MSVGPITAPVSMIIGLLPMFSAMNSELEKLLKAFIPIMSDRCLSPGS